MIYLVNSGNIRVFYRIRPLLSIRDQAAIRIDSMDEGVVHLEHSSGRKTSRAADFVIPTKYSQNEVRMTMKQMSYRLNTDLR